MDSQETTPRLYGELAELYDRRAEPSLRDRFLVLAMDAAQRGGRPEEAEQLRQRLLQLNPHHLLRPFASFAAASQSPDVQTYLRDLRRNYPGEVAQELLHSLRANAHRAAPEDRATANASEPLKPLSGQNGTTPATKAQRTVAPSPAAATPLRSEPERALPARTPPKPKRAAPAPRPAPGPREGPKQPRGQWFGVVLFVVLLLTGIAFTGYVIVRPLIAP